MRTTSAPAVDAPRAGHPDPASAAPPPPPKPSEAAPTADVAARREPAGSGAVDAGAPPRVPPVSPARMLAEMAPKSDRRSRPVPKAHKKRRCRR